MVLLIIIPFLNGYFIGNIPYFQTNPGQLRIVPRYRLRTKNVKPPTRDLLQDLGFLLKRNAAVSTAPLLKDHRVSENRITRNLVYHGLSCSLLKIDINSYQSGVPHVQLMCHGLPSSLKIWANVNSVLSSKPESESDSGMEEIEENRVETCH